MSYLERSNMERECLICGNPVYPMHEVDIGVGTIYSKEPPICEQCYEERPEEVAAILGED